MGRAISEGKNTIAARFDHPVAIGGAQCLMKRSNFTDALVVVRLRKP